MQERNGELLQELGSQRSIARGLAAVSEAVTVGATVNGLLQKGEPVSVSLAFIGWAIAAGATMNSCELSAKIRRLSSNN